MPLHNRRPLDFFICLLLLRISQICPLLTDQLFQKSSRTGEPCVEKVHAFTGRGQHDTAKLAKRYSTKNIYILLCVQFLENSMGMENYLYPVCHLYICFANNIFQ